MAGAVHSAAQVAQEAYAIWRGGHRLAPPPHWSDLDLTQRELLTFVVLHTARTAIQKELEQPYG